MWCITIFLLQYLATFVTFDTEEPCDADCMQCMIRHGYTFYAGEVHDGSRLLPSVLANLASATASGMTVKAYFRPCSDVGQAEEQVAVVTANVFDVAGQISALYLEALNHTAWPSSKSDAGRAMTNYLSHMARAMERTVKRIGIRTTEGHVGFCGVWSVENPDAEEAYYGGVFFTIHRAMWSQHHQRQRTEGNCLFTLHESRRVKVTSGF